MYDPDFVDFYQNVKASGWPDIESYQDFFGLPAHIQHECLQQHHMQSRLDQIVDPDYWSRINANTSMDVLTKGSIAFVPVAKCALMHYTDILHQQDWRTEPLGNLDLDHTHFFGFIRHPLLRFLKGMTQHLIYSFCEPDHSQCSDYPWQVVLQPPNWTKLFAMLEDPNLLRFIQGITVGDVHSMPYHLSMPKLLHKVHWIPLDAMPNKDCAILAQQFCKSHGVDVCMDSEQYRHQSQHSQLAVYEIIRKNFFSDHRQRFKFYQVYGPDLKLYYDQLSRFLGATDHHNS